MYLFIYSDGGPSHWNEKPLLLILWASSLLWFICWSKMAEPQIFTTCVLVSMISASSSHIGSVRSIAANCAPQWGPAALLAPLCSAAYSLNIKINISQVDLYISFKVVLEQDSGFHIHCGVILSALLVPKERLPALFILPSLQPFSHERWEMVLWQQRKRCPE